MGFYSKFYGTLFSVISWKKVGLPFRFLRELEVDMSSQTLVFSWLKFCVLRTGSG